MSTRSRFTFTAAAAAAVVLAAIAGEAGIARANLITNGNFQANASSFGYPGQQTFGGAGPLGGPNPLIADWTTTAPALTDAGLNGSTVNFSSTYNEPASLAGVTDFAFILDGTISQTVATAAGQQYTLTYVAAIPKGATTDGSLVTGVYDASLSGTLIGSQTFNTTNPLSDSEFNPYRVVFTATGPSTVISFAANGADSNEAFDVTNISLTATPEPSSLGLIGLAGAGVLLLGRKRLKAAM